MIFLLFALFLSLPAQALIYDLEGFKFLYAKARSPQSFRREGQKVTVKTSGHPIQIEVLGDDLVKIRLAAFENFLPEYTWSVPKDKTWPEVPFEVIEQNGSILVKASKIQVLVKEYPLITVMDGEGRVLFENRRVFADSFFDGVNNGSSRMTLGAEFKLHNDDHFYGLGQKFRGPGDTSIDWRGQRRGNENRLGDFGNTFEGHDGGANGNVFVPFFYNPRGYSLFLDTAYESFWEFDLADNFYIKQDCDTDWEQRFPLCKKAEMRFYVTAAKNSATHFKRYAEITGAAIMPPRWMMGFLQSKYGYENWNQVDEVAEKLRGNGYPVDGIFLDLQWFGGIPGVHYQNFNPEEAKHGPYNNCTYRRVGSFKFSGADGPFDFSNAAQRMANLKDKGIYIVPIEEGYIDNCNGKGYFSDNRPGAKDNRNFDEAAEQGFLALHRFWKDPIPGPNGEPAPAPEVLNPPALFTEGYLANTEQNRDEIGYFGQVGMVNTADPKAREWFWSKHLPILQQGAATFWTDLGEPERFRWWWKYKQTAEHPDGLWQQDIHNVWDLNRARSLFEGMRRDLPERRPFILSRSGYAGSQRYGVGIWTADAPAKLHWAAPQPAVHLSLSISGVPYTTSDIGGFGGPNASPELYTRWLQMESFSSLTRAHGNTTAGSKRRVHPFEFLNDYFGPKPEDNYGEVNKKYLKWRESLVPYIYTHAREAFDSGMPIMRALVLEYPEDSAVRNLGSEYLLGPNILVAPVLNGNFETDDPAESRDVYFPAGKWIDMHNGETHEGKEWKNIAAPIQKMPLFAREGAIIPKAPQSILSVSDPLYEKVRILEIYPSSKTSQYTLYDDDGLTNLYQENHFAKTEIAVRPDQGKVEVVVSPMSGTYSTKPKTRAYHLELHSPERPVSVEFDGELVEVEESPVLSPDANQLQATYFPALKKLYVSTPEKPCEIEKVFLLRYQR